MRVTVVCDSEVVIYDALIPNFGGLACARYGWGARAGGANENHWIDDIQFSAATALRIFSVERVENDLRLTYTGVLQSAATVEGPHTSAPAPLIVGVPPIVTVHPLSREVVPGDSVTCSIAVSGTPPFIYRWRQPPSVFTLPTSSNRQSFWTVTNVQSSKLGAYGVYVANEFGYVISRAAQLTFASDADADGLPDRWETEYGLKSNNVTEASQDLDGDSANNLEEYRAGTNPWIPPAFCSFIPFATGTWSHLIFGLNRIGRNRSSTRIHRCSVIGLVWLNFWRAPVGTRKYSRTLSEVETVFIAS